MSEWLATVVEMVGDGAMMGHARKLLDELAAVEIVPGTDSEEAPVSMLRTALTSLEIGKQPDCNYAMNWLFTQTGESLERWLD